MTHNRMSAQEKKHPLTGEPARFRYTIEEHVASFILTHRYRSLRDEEHNRKLGALAASCQDGQCVFNFANPDKESTYVFRCERLLRAPFTYHLSAQGRERNLEETLARHKEHFGLHAYQLDEGVMIVEPQHAYIPKSRAILSAVAQVRRLRDSNDEDALDAHARLFEVDALQIIVSDKALIPRYQDALAAYRDIEPEIVAR